MRGLKQETYQPILHGTAKDPPITHANNPKYLIALLTCEIWIANPAKATDCPVIINGKRSFILSE